MRLTKRRASDLILLLALGSSTSALLASPKISAFRTIRKGGYIGLLGHRLGTNLYVASSSEQVVNDADPISALELKRDDAGIYQVENKEMHEALLKANPDRLVVLKFYAPWCRACKGLAPRFKTVSMNPQNKDIVFAELNVQPNREYVKSLGILALPCVHFYGGSQGLVENFPCGPSKIPILKTKLREYLRNKIDKDTGLLLPMDIGKAGESEPLAKESIVEGSDDQESFQIKERGRDEDYTLSENDLKVLRKVPYLKDFTEQEFSNLIKTSTLETFDAGAIVMRQGMPGQKFYVIQSGEVEVSISSQYEDPLSTPPGYLGAVINTVGPGNWFGERALITGEPRAASLRTTTLSKCFVFNQKNFPETTVLSGKLAASTERIAEINEKYGAIETPVMPDSKLKSVSIANQSRGSVNNPNPIVGVDVGEDEVEQEELDPILDISKQGEIFSILRRFKLVQMAKTCHEHIQKTKPKFDNVYESSRRALLLKRATRAQKEEFKEVFKLIDQNEDGTIQESELLRVVNSLSTDEREQAIAGPGQSLTFNQFMAIMAEAEFYNLFVSTFNSLDVHNSGFIPRKDLRKILAGVRDLISDEQIGIIGSNDENEDDQEDIQVNYEQFTRMMLGAKL